MEYASKDIRNILVAGHAGCGKTTLTESLLYLSGATERMGRVEDGTTASDFDPEEARRKASLNSSVIPVESNGTKFNLIDVPGLFDFETGAAEGITAAESVLICVSGRSGVTVGAEKAYKLALKNNKARMVFVTKSDLENSDYFKILEQLKIKFGPSICPCVVPARLDDGTVAYINLFSQKAFKYESGKQVQIDLAAMCTAAGNALEHCSGAVETAAICKQLNAQGAVTSLMTGSGAAVFGVFDDEQKAKQAQQALQAGYDQVYLARPVRGGARVLPRPAKKDHTPRQEK